MAGSEGDNSDRAPTDYDVLKRLADRGDIRARMLLSIIEPKIEEHMSEFYNELLGVDMDPSQRQRVFEEEKRNFSQYVTGRTISEFKEQNPVPKDFDKNMAAAKAELEARNKGTSSAQQELHEKKNPDEAKALKEQPKQKSEVVATAKKNPIINEFLKSDAPVADVLVDKYNEDHKAFHEAIEDLHSPAGGDLILAIVHAIAGRQGNQNRHLLLFAFDIFPELFDKLTPEQLSDMAYIFEDQAVKFGGINRNKIKDLNIQNCAEIPEKLKHFLNIDFTTLPPEEQQAWCLVGYAGGCRQKAMEFESESYTLMKDTLHSNTSEKTEPKDIESQKVVMTALDATPIEKIDFLSPEKQIQLQIERNNINSRQFDNAPAEHAPDNSTQVLVANETPASEQELVPENKPQFTHLS